MFLSKAVRIFVLAGFLVPMAAQSMRDPVGSADFGASSALKKPALKTPRKWDPRSAVGLAAIAGANCLVIKKLQGHSFNLSLLGSALAWAAYGAGVAAIFAPRGILDWVADKIELAGVEDAGGSYMDECTFNDLLKQDDVVNFNIRFSLDTCNKANLRPGLLTDAANAGAVKIFDRLVEVGAKPTAYDYRLLNDALMEDLSEKEKRTTFYQSPAFLSFKAKEAAKAKELARLKVQSPFTVNPEGEVNVTLAIDAYVPEKSIGVFQRTIGG